MFGLILIILAQVAYAFGGLVIRKYLQNYPPLFISSFMVVFSALLFIPVICFGFKDIVTHLSVKSSLPLIGAAVLWLVIAETLYVVGFQKAPSITLGSLMTLFYPLFSAILGIIFLREPLTARTILAGVLMVGGFILLSI